MINLLNIFTKKYKYFLWKVTFKSFWFRTVKKLEANHFILESALQTIKNSKQPQPPPLLEGVFLFISFQISDYIDLCHVL